MPQKISCDQVKSGMYILKFGGSWFDHPFWRAKFLIETDEDVRRVHESGAPYVMIDEERGIPASESPTIFSAPPLQNQGSNQAARSKRAGRRTEVKGDDSRVAEYRRATALVSRSKKRIAGVFDEALSGSAIDIEAVASIVDEITQSVAHSPQALLGVTRLKNKDDYTYLHSISVCMLMVTVAQHLEMNHPDIRDLGLAGLLHDIGKLSIADDILNKPGQLTAEEFDNVRRHPEQGYKLLSKTPDISETALDVCRHHHEKVDGTGYPFSLNSNSISFAARLGAICDVFDALTSNRAYKQAWTPEQAISEMWGWNGHFDSEILFNFMQALGIFSPGMLVRLNSNRLAIVLEQKPWRRGAHALIFYSVSESMFLKPKVVMIGKNYDCETVVSAEDPDDWGFSDWDGLRERLVPGVAV